MSWIEERKYLGGERGFDVQQIGPSEGEDRDGEQRQNGERVEGDQSVPESEQLAHEQVAREGPHDPLERCSQSAHIQPFTSHSNSHELLFLRCSLYTFYI